MPNLYEEEGYIYSQVPIRIYNHDLEKEDIYTYLHWHRSIELNLVTEGRIRASIGGNSCELKENDWVIINSGELHMNTWINREDHYKGITVLISKSFLDLWLGKDMYFCYPQDVHAQENIRMILQQFGQINAAPQPFSSLDRMVLLFSLTKLLGQYCVGQRKEKKTVKRLERMKEIINYIDQHYKEEISLENIADSFHYSSAHLSRLFKEHVGFNFYEYLQSVRLMNTIDQLKSSEDVSLLDCSLEHGFPNAKSFIMTFKKMYGCTPSEWRKGRENKNIKN